VFLGSADAVTNQFTQEPSCEGIRICMGTAKGHSNVPKGAGHQKLVAADPPNPSERLVGDVDGDPMVGHAKA
jgi:hypothetical protein